VSQYLKKISSFIYEYVALAVETAHTLQIGDAKNLQGVHAPTHPLKPVLGKQASSYHVKYVIISRTW
jgi:hypothetical protein